jgi:hypothetical protein
MIFQLKESPSLCDGEEGRTGATSENPQVPYILVLTVSLVYFYVCCYFIQHSFICRTSDSI